MRLPATTTCSHGQVAVPPHPYRTAMKPEEVLAKLAFFSFDGDRWDEGPIEQSPTSIVHAHNKALDQHGRGEPVEVEMDQRLQPHLTEQRYAQPSHSNDQQSVSQSASNVCMHMEDVASIASMNHDTKFRPLKRYNSLPNSAVALPASIPFKSSLKTTSSNRRLNRTVSFHKLCIREYSVQLGDNPSCRWGVPISLGWDYEEQEALSLDDWEKMESIQDGDHPTPPTRRRRRKAHELILSYHDRRQLLKSAGYSREELFECMQSVRKIQQERGMTELFLAVAPLEDALETVVNRVQNALFRLGKKGCKMMQAHT